MCIHVYLCILTERRHDMEDEKKLEMTDGMDERSLKQRYQELRDRDDLQASNFAELLRDSTLRNMRKLTDWKQPKVCTHKFTQVEASIYGFFYA